MLSLLPASKATAGGTSFADADPAAVSGITDPWLRLQLAAQRLTFHETQLKALRAIRRDAVGELVHQRRTPHSRIATFLRLIGSPLTKSRVGQLALDALGTTRGGGDLR